MKKVLIIIAIIAVLAVTSLSAVACTNLNQLNMLSMGWLDYEEYTYDVYEVNGETSTLIGEMTYTYYRIADKQKVNVNGKDFTPGKGAKCEYSLNITSGEYAGTTMKSEVVVTSTFTPKASYKVFNSNKPELSYTSFADYTTGSKTGTYTYTTNGAEPVKSDFKKTSAYDNESLYTLIRASVFDTKSYSLSMNVPDNATYKLSAVAVGMNATNAKIKTNYSDVEYECSSIICRMTAKKGQGTSNVLYYTNKPINVNGKDAVKVLVQIVEGDYKYVLKNISTEKAEA